MEMPEIVSLSSKIEKQLPAELVNFMRLAGEMAQSQGQNLYLVGGVVRDLLLGQTNLDLDLVLEGNAIGLAQKLAEIKRAKITIHPRFGTAKLRWNKWSIDLATTRSETYIKPGALPHVEPSSIDNDLSRRDFTINTMAVHLNPGHYGKLIDQHWGRDDLEHKLIRILHEKSFIDDATRIWRGLRYEQRLGFQLEPNTLKLLKRDIPMLDTISGDRIRHELELILNEEHPEKVLYRAEELKVLPQLHPALKGNGWLTEKFEQARKSSSPDLPPIGLYFALLVYRLTDKETEQLISRLRLPKSLVQTLRDSNSLQTKLALLADPELSRSSIYRLLHDYSLPAIMANSLAGDPPVVRQHLQLFLDKLRYIKSSLTGNNLKRLGVAPGPDIKEVLELVLEARLDGKITSREGEEGLVNNWLVRNR